MAADQRSFQMPLCKCATFAGGFKCRHAGQDSNHHPPVIDAFKYRVPLFVVSQRFIQLSAASSDFSQTPVDDAFKPFGRDLSVQFFIADDTG